MPAATPSHGVPANALVRARDSRSATACTATNSYSDVVHYIKGQRCSGVWDRADRSAPCVGDGVRRDVHGGWYDASGDYSKYLSHLSYANFLNPQQTPLVVWTLARVWHRYAAIDAPPLLRERIRDEALYGADFLMRMQDPEGFWYVTVFDGWSKDPEQRELCSYRTQLGVKGDDYQAGWRQGGGMAAAALALASTLGDGPDHAAVEYRDAALRGFRHLQRHGLEYLDDGHENIIDDTCALLAAVELASAFGDDMPIEVTSELEARAMRLLGRRRETDGYVWLAADDGERSWFHASDEGLPGLALLLLANTSPDHARAACELVAQLVSSRLDLDASSSNPFGYPRHWIKLPGKQPCAQWFFPHDNESGYWWQGENARVGSLATLLLAAAEAMPDRELGAGCSRRRREPRQLDPRTQSVRCLHAPGIRPQQPALPSGLPQRAGRRVQRHHVRLRGGIGHRLPPDAVGGRQGTQLALGRTVDATRGMADARARARHRHRSPRCLTARPRWDMNVT